MTKSVSVEEGFSHMSTWSQSDSNSKKHEMLVAEDRVMHSRLSGMEMLVLCIIGQTNSVYSC